jgi:hypothetical protein
MPAREPQGTLSLAQNFKKSGLDFNTRDLIWEHTLWVLETLQVHN